MSDEEECLGGREFVLLWGCPIDGMRIVGPFASADSAASYTEIEKEIRDSTWWTVELEKPDWGGEPHEDEA